MRSLGRNQFIVLGACVITIVLLGFVSTSPSERAVPVVEEQQNITAIPLQELVNEENNLLGADVAGIVETFEHAIIAETDIVRKGILLDSLIDYLGDHNKFILAASFTEQKATATTGSATDWMIAGERYRRAGTFQTDMARKKSLYDASIRCFEKSLQLDPGNLDAQVGLGIAIVDGTNDPMKGIGMLQDVEKKDSNHIEMQLALAEFAMRSNQVEKAIYRFNKVLVLNPQKYALHLSLADIYGSMNDTAMVIYHLKQYSSLTDDVVVKAAIDKDIQTLERK